MSEIDRSETIDAVYVQRGSRLQLRRGDFSSPPWDPVGEAEHSLSAVRVALVGWSDRGAVALGASTGTRVEWGLCSRTSGLASRSSHSCT